MIFYRASIWHKVYPAVTIVTAKGFCGFLYRTHLDDFNDKESGTVILCKNKKIHTREPFVYTCSTI